MQGENLKSLACIDVRQFVTGSCFERDR